MKGRFRPFYGKQAEKYKFLRVPMDMFNDPKFEKLSLEAILLYSFLLNRMDLSRSNGWLTKDKRVFIIFTLKEIRLRLRCGKDKAIKVLRELDTENGIGLIERVARDAGKSDIIFVNDFNEYVEGCEQSDDKTPDTKVNPIIDDRIFGDEYGGDYSGQLFDKNEPVGFSDRCDDDTGLKDAIEYSVCGCDKISRVGKSDHPVGKNDHPVGKSDHPVGKSAPNNIDLYYTDSVQNKPNQIVLSYAPVGVDNSPHYSKERMEELAEIRSMYEKLIKEHIGYEYLVNSNYYRYEREMIDGMISIMADTVTFERETVRVNKMDMPYQVVKSKLLKITSSVFEYAVDTLREAGISRGVTSEKNYILTVLYNAADTLDFHYKQMVNHDMYGNGLEERGIKLG